MTEQEQNLVYVPEKIPDESIKCLKSTLGVKFSKDIFLMKSFLDQKNIEYKIEDLEDGPLGLVLRIKRD